MTKGPRSMLLASAVILLGSIVLLFARLGHYALWDDEAITAMTSRAVLHTGDTSAKVDDHNYLVYRNGLLVRGMKDRYTSPLQFYLIAPFIGLFGDSNFVCRLPMALCGLVTVILLVCWLWWVKPSPFVWWSAAFVLLTNASFFLFFRQCRYYGLATMLTGIVAYIYCTRETALLKRSHRSDHGSLLHTGMLAIALAALLAAQYLDYAAVVGCLVVDYALWGRKRPFTIRHWLIILLPQVIVGTVVLSIWNPLMQQTGNHYHTPSWLSDRLHLLWWNWRDMIGCDFVILPLLGACPLLYFARRSSWLLRAPLALFVFIFTIALAVPTSLAQAHNAEVRYLAPALVPCIGVAIVAIWGLQALKPKLQAVLILIALISAFVQPAPKDAPNPDAPEFGATALLFYHELMVPQVESYTPVIDWINANVPAGSTINVQPPYKTYPLMFRAPKAIYAWQLSGDAVEFAPMFPPPGELSTITAKDGHGKPVVAVSIVNPIHCTDQKLALALIDAWNQNPTAAKIAIATGETSVTLTVVQKEMAFSFEGSFAFASPTRALPGGWIPISSAPERPEFRDLPDIHFLGRVAPDYMIRFGSNPESRGFPEALDYLATRGFHYNLVQTLHFNWKDLYRPERIWRSFVTIQPEKGDEIYVYQRTGP